MIYPKEEIGRYVTLRQGFAINKKTNHHMSDEITPLHLLRIGDMKENSFCMYVKDTIPENFIAHEEDIIYTRTGQVGLVFRNQHGVVHNNCFTVTPIDENVLCREYLYYALQSEEFYMEANSRASGVAQPDLPHSAFESIKIYLPELNRQKKIGQILLGYDELILNNQKQIKLLEEAAQRLYKEWFVDLRFPNYEECNIIDGVPEGWKKEKLVDLCDVQYGYAFDGALFNDKGNGTPIIRIRNIPSGITGDYTSENADDQYRIQNGEIVVGMDGEFHINSWCGETAYLVQRTCCFRPHDKIIHGWLLWAIYDPIKYFEKTVVGATVSHLGKKHIDTIELLRGPDKMYVPFETYFKKRQLLLNQNIKLVEMRDRLLPKLMNGEIEV